MRYIEGENRSQINLFPKCLDEMIDENNIVRIIDALVETFNIEAMNFTHSITKSTGRKPYNPKDILKIYVYGYFNGIRSSRKLEKECLRNIEVMWLTNNLSPDFKTIADFRKDNKQALIEVFKQFNMLCYELNLIGKEVIVIDGSKFRASNSRRKNLTKRKVKKIIEHYQEIAEEYVKMLEDSDEKTEEMDIDKTNVLNSLEKVKDKIIEYQEKALEIEKNGEISLTDTDSKHMSVSNNGTDIAHNVQIVVDRKEHIVVAVDVVSSPADQGQLFRMAEKAISEMNIDLDSKKENIITVLADKGYYKYEDFEKCKKARIKAIVPKQKAPTVDGNREYSKDNFRFDKEKDQYYCPQNHILKCVSKPTTKTKKYRNAKACKQCEIG